MIKVMAQALGMTRDNDGDTSGAIARVLALRVPFVCEWFAPLHARTFPLFPRLSACLSWQISRAYERMCCACAGPLCARALHLLACAFSVSVRVLCLAFGRHVQLR